LGGHNFNSVSWRSGTLRAYESMTSIGAKYCLFNRVSPSDFIEFITQFLPARDLSKYESTVDVPGFKLSKFSRVIGEPIATVLTQSTRELKWFVKSEIVSPNFNFSHGREPINIGLRICPVCSSQGYHATFHNFPWLHRCLIHGHLLQNVQVRRGGTVSRDEIYAELPGDLGPVQSLFSFWASDSSGWMKRTPQMWAKPNHGNLRHKFDEMTKLLTAVSIGYAQEDYLGNNLPHFINKSLGEEVWYLAQFFGLQIPQWGKCFLRQEKLYERNVHFNCTNDMAAKLLNISGQLNTLGTARRIECEVAGEMPRWRTFLQRLHYRLIQRHRHCDKLILALLAKWSDFPDFSIWSDGTRSPAIELKERGLKPCPRLLTLDLFRLNVGLDDYADNPVLIYGVMGLVADIRVRLGYQSNDRSTVASVPGIFGTSMCFFSNNRTEISFSELPKLLASILDEYLLEWIWGVDYALYQADDQINSDSYDLENFSPIMPSVVIEPTKHGLLFRFSSPISYGGAQPWTETDVTDKKHSRSVSMIFKAIDQFMTRSVRERQKRILEDAEKFHRERSSAYLNKKNCK